MFAVASILLSLDPLHGGAGARWLSGGKHIHTGPSDELAAPVSIEPAMVEE